MDYRNLGKSGLLVSKLSMGTMPFGNQTDRPTAFRIMDKVLDTGINLFDCADIYPLGGGMELAGTSEKILGEWLSTHVRDSIVITSKCFAAIGKGANQKGLGRLHIMNAIDGSLRRLKTDYIDLYIAHAFDDTVPLEETLRAFEDIVRAGKVRYIGVSNWSSWQIVKALGFQQREGYLPIIADQLRYNLLFRRPEDDIFPMCLSEQVGIMAYNPLAGGLLSGRYKINTQPGERSRFDKSVGGDLYHKRYWNEAIFKITTCYLTWCCEQELNPVTTAISWILSKKPVNTVLIGASKPEQLDDLLSTVQMSLKEEQVQWLDGLWFSLPRNSDEMPN